jgi:flagellum-specific peptidoglycan hydrolase FlgJ
MKKIKMKNESRKTLAQRVMIPVISGALMLGIPFSSVVNPRDSAMATPSSRTEFVKSDYTTPDRLIGMAVENIREMNEARLKREAEEKARIYKTPESPEDFIEYIKDYAVKTQDETGIPASVMIAQAALETGWGRQVHGYNFFGIKSPSKSGRFLKTHEYEDGKRVPKRESFKTYTCAEDCFDDYSKVIGSRFEGAMKNRTNPEKFARAIHKAGYATDPNYSRMLTSIINQFDLTKYDQTLLAYNQQQ